MLKNTKRIRRKKKKKKASKKKRKGKTNFTFRKVHPRQGQERKSKDESCLKGTKKRLLRKSKGRRCLEGRSGKEKTITKRRARRQTRGGRVRDDDRWKNSQSLKIFPAWSHQH